MTEKNFFVPQRANVRDDHADKPDMSWHYVQGETSVGPVNEAALAQLLTEGTITTETLVWNPHLADWTPLRDVESIRPQMPASSSGVSLETKRRSFHRVEAVDPADAPITIESLRAPFARTDDDRSTDGSDLLGWLCFTSPGEFRFFLVTFVLASLVTGWCWWMRPEWLFVPFLAQGALVIFVGDILYAVRMFQTSVLWGIAGLFIPFVDFAFLFLHWDKVKRPFLLQLAGVVVVVATYQTAIRTA